MRLQKLCAHKRTVCLAYCVRLSWQCVSLVAVFFSFGGGISAATQTDGEILASKPNASLPVFDSLDEFSRNYFPKAMYEEARSQADFDILEIAYASDGLHVPGILIRPKNAGGKKWPAIIFNRGGTGDYSRIVDDGVTPCGLTNPTCLTVVDLYQFAKAGFVVIASDYRFHLSTAKRDEWGGRRQRCAESRAGVEVARLRRSRATVHAGRFAWWNHDLYCVEARNSGQSSSGYRRRVRLESVDGHTA